MTRTDLESLIAQLIVNERTARRTPALDEEAAGLRDAIADAMARKQLGLSASPE